MCDYYDDVGALRGFGAGNGESLAELVWAFFEYWAWKHDYNNAVVSVRTGGFLTKSQKEWTRRVGNERHLVCIEVRGAALGLPTYSGTSHPHVPYIERASSHIILCLIMLPACAALVLGGPGDYWLLPSQAFL